MSTAREQARKAVDLAGEYEDSRFLIGPDVAGDAASDVWEPLLRRAVEILQPFVKNGQTTLGEGGDWLRMKEALGD